MENEFQSVSLEAGTRSYIIFNGNPVKRAFVNTFEDGSFRSKLDENIKVIRDKASKYIILLLFASSLLRISLLQIYKWIKCHNPTPYLDYGDIIIYDKNFAGCFQ